MTTEESPAQECIRLMTSDDLEMILSWRNHPDIRRYMYTQHDILQDEHQCWFEQASKNAYKHLLIYDPGSFPLGFVQLSQLNGSLITDWGFYLAPDAPSGTGRRLGHATLKYAFEYLGLHKICGQVLIYNEPSIRFHRSLGFQQEGLLRDQHYDGQSYYDVICFGLLKSDWYQGQ